jgi:DNA-binding response OmpR family regulator
MKILIAIDDEDIIRHVTMTLNTNKPDWELSIIDSGKQCLKAVSNGNCPDVVILGLNIPDIPCFDLIEKIRDNSDVLIVVLSDDKDMNTLVRAFSAGANDYIMEPFNKAVFIARLQSLVRRRTWDMQATEKRQR